MSLQNSSIWLHNGSGSLANGQMQFDTSVRMDQKRGYQWLMDVSEQELLLNKKQAIETVKYTSEPAALNSSLWPDVSEPQTGSAVGDHLFCPKPVRSPYVSDKNNPSTNPTFVNIEKDFHNQFDHSSNRVNMPYAVEDSLSLNTGHREVEVNKASISENCLPSFMGNSFCPGEKDKLVSAAADSRTAINMFPLTAYKSADGISISENPAVHQDKNFISVGSASSASNSSLMITRPFYDGIDNNVQSIGQAFNRRNYKINTLGEPYVKENSSLMPTSSTGHGNLFSANLFYNKINDAFASAGSSYNAGGRNISICGQQDATVVSIGALDNQENSSILSMVENSKKGQQTSTTISFGSFQENPGERDHLGRLINGYTALLNQSSAQSSGAGRQVSAEHLTANVIPAASLRAHNTQKNKEKVKKGPLNNFPTNVKSLLSTGILNGVPVKYVSWSREKNLRGVVKDTGYLCGCQDCNLTKVVNAYEFERHAGCKTKHPNNHIYFENGKTIYAVVQELKGTPQESLFEVMENVAGSPVNQKNFNAWKASYQAATRELLRIYTNEEMTAQS